MERFFSSHSGRLVGRKYNYELLRSVGTLGEIDDYIHLVKFCGLT